jgi:hypothetical protein
MRQLTAVGDQHVIALGRVHLSAQLAVDGGVTLTVWSGPNRHDSVSFAYTDRAIARRRYAQIAQLAHSGLTAEHIDAHVNGPGNTAVAAVRQILTESQEFVSADPSPAAGRLSVAIADAYGDLVTAAERSAEADLAARINADLDGCAPMLPARTFAEIRDRHAAAIRRDRKQVA